MSTTALIGTTLVGTTTGITLLSVAAIATLLVPGYHMIVNTQRRRRLSIQLDLAVHSMGEGQVYRSLAAAQSARARRYKAYAEESWERGING